jgi:hypothetical protein
VTNILPNLGNQEEKVSLSERFKSTAMKLKEKFSPSKISNFVGLNSNGKRENTLERILSFMKTSHERKMQMYGVERLFQEELLNEDERKHNEFVKVLKNYVSGETGGATLVVPGENDEAGILKKITGLVMATVNKTINALVGGIRTIIDGMIGPLMSLLELTPLIRIVSSIVRLIGLFGTVLTNPAILTLAALSAYMYGLYKINEEVTKTSNESNLPIDVLVNEVRTGRINIKDVPEDIRSKVSLAVVKQQMTPEEAQEILDNKKDPNYKKEIEIYGRDWLENRASSKRDIQYELDRLKPREQPLVPNPTAPPPIQPLLNQPVPNRIDVLNSTLDAPGTAATPASRTQKNRSIKPMLPSPMLPSPMLPSTASPDREILGSDLPSAERIVYNRPPIIGINLIGEDIPSSSTSSLTVQSLENFIPIKTIQNNSLKTDQEVGVQPIINERVSNNSINSIPSITAEVKDNTPIIDYVNGGSAAQF